MECTEFYGPMEMARDSSLERARDVSMTTVDAIEFSFQSAREVSKGVQDQDQDQDQRE